MAVATPEQDQFFRRVWPDEKMIWERGDMAKKDREKCLFQCPICYQPCVTNDDLKRHLKVGHSKREVKKIYVELKLAVLTQRLFASTASMRCHTTPSTWPHESRSHTGRSAPTCS